jgi:membrane protease YdiL (CAAX protease family)
MVTVIKSKNSFLTEAILCSLSLMVFSFFIHFEFPVRLISFMALVVPAWIFSRNLQSFSDLRKIVSVPASGKLAIIYLIPGALLGFLFAIMYRWHLEISLFPISLTIFALVAALIGCMEELVFRGIIQDYVKSINVPFSIFFSSLSHTAYKCCIFLAPVAAADFNIGFLAFWTFIVGILSGTIRQLSSSLIPSLIAHALFDIMVYGEYANAPWWVW